MSLRERLRQPLFQRQDNFEGFLFLFVLFPALFLFGGFCLFFAPAILHLHSWGTFLLCWPTMPIIALILFFAMLERRSFHHFMPYASCLLYGLMTATLVLGA